MTEIYQNGYWTTSDAHGFHAMRNPQDLHVSPQIVEVVKKSGAKNFLDLGCGNAFVDTILPDSIRKTLYDVNPDFIPTGMAQYNCQIVKDLSELPAASFDCILISMVLVTLKTKEEYHQVLSAAARLKKPDGIIIITDPHPCFRWHQFRYCNNLIREEAVNYFEEGRDFTTRFGSLDGQCVTFTDHHHSLAFNINALADEGLFIQEMIELKDQTYDSHPCNQEFPPYYILICK